MKAYEKIEELVNTRINGNSIKGNETYENMLKQVNRADINHYANWHEIEASGFNKLEMIESIRDALVGGFI